MSGRDGGNAGALPNGPPSRRGPRRLGSIVDGGLVMRIKRIMENDSTQGKDMKGMVKM